jgi:TolB-like protein
MRLALRIAAFACLAAATPAGAADDLDAAAGHAGDELAAALQRSPERASIHRIAVAPFAESGPALKGLGRSVEEAAAARLAAGAGVEVMDRAKLAAVVGEQKLAAMLGSRRAGGEDLAGLAGAQAVLSGEIQDAGDRTVLLLRLTAAGGQVVGTSRREAALPGRARGSGRGSVESADIVVAMRKLADGLASGFGRLPGSAKYRRLAVLSFGEVGAEAKNRQVGAIVTAEIATNLRRDHGLLLVERAKLTEVLGELKLQQALAMDAAQAGQIGKMADAQALVIGSVSEAGDRFLVNARIVATQTGETLAAESQSVAAAGMISLASDAVVLRSRSGAVFRSILVPGFGQFYNRQPVKAWMFIGAEVGLLGSALAFHLSGSAAYDDYRSVSRASGPNPSAEATRLYDDAASRWRTRNWLLAGAAAVWALNVADAWLAGVDGESLLGGPAAGVAVAPSPGGALAVARLRF